MQRTSNLGPGNLILAIPVKATFVATGKIEECALYRCIIRERRKQYSIFQLLTGCHVQVIKEPAANKLFNSGNISEIDTSSQAKL